MKNAKEEIMPHLYYTARPISASVGKSDFFKFNLNSKSKASFYKNVNKEKESSNQVPSLSNPYMLSFANIANKDKDKERIRIKSASKVHIVGDILEKEKLLENNIHLKSNLNFLNKELTFAKSEVYKRDMELNKQNKIISDIYIDSQKNNINSNADIKLLSKVKESNFIANMKRQYKELKKQFHEKELEIENLKKTMKMTRIKEIQSECQTYIEEIKKLRTNLENVIQQNNNHE